MNTDIYKALLAVDRLARNRPDDSGDLRMIREAILAVCDALKRARASKKKAEAIALSARKARAAGNRNAALREYIAANPGCLCIAAAHALGMTARDVSERCRKMAATGMLSREGSPAKYTLIRKPPAPLSADELRKRVRERVRRASLARRESAIRAARIAKAPDPYSVTHRGVMVTGTVKEQAEAVCSASGAIDVYRFPSGAITWRKRGSQSPGGVFVGSYDEGSDYRRVVEDLAVAA